MKLPAKIFTVTFVLFVLSASIVFGEAQIKWTVNRNIKNPIHFPDIPGYITLVCDFHQHTIFSDGSVWPTVRVEEAQREGFDAIAITDHIEYKPHKTDVSTDRNRAYEIALPTANALNILFPKGSEITPDTPPGHFNALFLKDSNLINTKNPENKTYTPEELIESIKIANEQGAFVFWNHPGWKGVEKGKWQDIHTKLYEKKWLHGIEICNGPDLFKEAFQTAIEKNLTLLGNSDIHGPDDLQKTTGENHRTVTLVFVKERTLDSIKEALFAGRTAVWCENNLYGKEEFLRPLFDNALNIKPFAQTEKTCSFQITNTAEISFIINKGSQKITIPAKSVAIMKAESEEALHKIDFACKIQNFIIAPEKTLEVTFTCDFKN